MDNKAVYKFKVSYQKYYESVFIPLAFVPGLDTAKQIPTRALFRAQ